MELVVLWRKCFVDGRDGCHAAQRTVDTRAGLSKSGGGIDLSVLSELLRKGPAIHHLDGAEHPISTRKGRRRAIQWD